VKRTIYSDIKILFFFFIGNITPLSQSPDESSEGRSRQTSFLDPSQPAKLDRSVSEGILPAALKSLDIAGGQKYLSQRLQPGFEDSSQIRRPLSPPPLSSEEALSRALALSKKLSGSNIPSQVTEAGDLMLDMTGYKSSEEDALRAEIIARKILAEELEGNYDIGALIGADDQGNLWIYSSEEAKAAASASCRASLSSLKPRSGMNDDTVSDPGYHSDSDQSISDTVPAAMRPRTQSDVQPGFPTPPRTPKQGSSGEPSLNFAKTLRLTSDQLKTLGLKPGANPVTFSVNKATCPATMYLWSYRTPTVISDIDGTITKYVFGESCIARMLSLTILSDPMP
jgi:phosphatidate phosphatase LPIN